MITTNTTLIEIKKTKSLTMLYDTEAKGVRLFFQDGAIVMNDFFIPMSKIFQVKRGLESAVQKFYRKHSKNVSK